MTITEMQDQAISEGIIATMVNPSGWADSVRGAYNYRNDWLLRSPMFKRGEAIQFVPDLMEVGRPYPFQFMDWWFVAVKRRGGELDFFHISGE